MDDIDNSGVAEWKSEGGKLLLGHCESCGEAHYYPRRICPFCFSSDVGRIEAAGTGHVYSHSFTPRGPDGPYVLAYVTLDEGISMLTHIVDVDPADVSVDLPVVLEFRTIGERELPVFRPSK